MVVCLSLFAIPAFCQSPATSQLPAPFTQRRINETAATLERARRGLLETPHLRQTGEGWPDYIRRVTVPLPGETPAVYRKRLEGYVDTLEEATRATAAARQMPILKETGDANRKFWTRVNQDLIALPGRILRLRELIPQAAGGDHKVRETLGTEMTQTLQLLIDAQNALRDALP